MSLRLQLTLWVVVVFAFLQACSLGVVWLYERSTIQRNFDYRLHDRVNELESALADAPAMLPRESIARYLDSRLHNDRYGLRVLGLFDAQGRNVLDGGPGRATWSALGLGEPPSPRETAFVTAYPTQFSGRPADGTSTFGAAAAEAGEPLRVCVRSIAKPSKYPGNVAIVAVAMPLLPINQRIAIVTDVSVVAITVSFGFAAISAWFIAGMAVAPLERLRAFAKRLRPESIGDKFDDRGSHPEIVRLNRELERAFSRIQDGFIAQERFLSNVSHEFKTPIAVLLTEAQTLDRRDASPPVAEFVDSVSSEMGRLSRLVESFLTLTRVRDGKGLAVMTRYAVNDLVVDCVSHAALMARQHGVRLEPELLSDEQDTDACVQGDPELLRTMLDNLLRNAIRFSPKGQTVHVQLACIRGSERQPGTLTITVRDHGPGIPADRLKSIFDRFAQAHDGNRYGRGHGLGLPIALGIAELHGGSISVRDVSRNPSAADAADPLAPGCEFVIRLPRAPDTDPSTGKPIQTVLP